MFSIRKLKEEVKRAKSLSKEELEVLVDSQNETINVLLFCVAGLIAVILIF